MTDILEPYAVQEVFADNAENHIVINGVLHRTYYALQEIGGILQKVAVIRIAMPIGSVPDEASRAIAAVTQATASKTVEQLVGCIPSLLS